MIKKTLSLLALAIVLAGIAGCGPNAASVRKEAQANADKYFEFVKAGNLEGAYNNTFSANYKRQLDRESYVRFQQAVNNKFGEIQEYAVADEPKIDLDRHSVVFVYNVKSANMATVLNYNVRMVQEGSEWRIDAVEPKFSQMTPEGPSAPLPKKAPPPENAPAPQKAPAPKNSK